VAVLQAGVGAEQSAALLQPVQMPAELHDGFSALQSADEPHSAQ
jgi:hypothetical protein